MRAQVDEQEAPPDESGLDDGGRGRKPLPRMLAGALAAVVGGWFGGPVFAPHAAEAWTSFRADETAAATEASTSSGDVQHLMPNLLVNPANSGGVRFLVVTLALDVAERAVIPLTERDAEARDRVLTVLASKTVEQLGDVGRRDELRGELRRELNEMLEFEGVVRVFLPQFVIQ